MDEHPSKALVRRSSETQLSQLMPPPSKRIKRPQKVLDEDIYTDAVSQIIRRDFFPGLAESDAQQEYLDALESGDNTWIASAGDRLKVAMTPGGRTVRRGVSIPQISRAFETPSGAFGDTPISVTPDPSGSFKRTRTSEVDTNMSLDQFQAKYTSEDNESFYKLIDKQNEKRAEKYAWLWNGNQLPSKRQLAQRKVERKLLESGQSLLDNGGEKPRMAAKGAHDKPAMPDGWRTRPDNNLLFKPNSVEDVVETTAQKAQAESRAAPKMVLYGNTRLPAPHTDQAHEPHASPSLSAVRDAIAGRRRCGYSESSVDQTGGETPRVNGYAFVDDEPEERPLIQRSMPIDLGTGSSTPNPFNIKEQSRREDLHHELVDRASRLKRSSSALGMVGKVAATPIPKFPSSPRVRSGDLTPAAQRLWSRVGGSRGARTPDVFHLKESSTGKREPTSKVRWTPKSR